ncbi:sensor domain-containing protein [Bacillus marasmi]|uniref:sensor domain-containing protein n=1 Tax=Bacillus marasmi TaxID=1926279 RepID=UPI0011CA1985|nr:EAL domain-containing protein [Bacillus marasmi]
MNIFKKIKKWIDSQFTFMQRKNELALNEERYKSLFEHHPDGVFSLDLKGNFISSNTPWGDWVGFSPMELIGKPFLDVIPDRDNHYVFVNHFTKTINGSKERYELSFINKEGKMCHIQFTNIPIYVKNEIVGIYGIGKDITENKINEEKIKQMALHDSLTGLPNRVLFSEIIQLALADAERNKEMLAIMLLDLDRFKTINDILGHDVGDQLLKQTAKRLVASLRKNDTVCRQGGDEFSILLKGINRPEDVMIIASKILHSLNKPYIINDNEVITTPSMGIAVYPIDGETSADLLQKADFAMYAVKEQGRNHFRLYSKEKHHDYSKQYLLEKELRKALEKKEFTVFYQPQFDIPTGKMIGVEALLRWHHPDLGMISPVDFIPVAEQAGMIVPIGEWVLKTACQQAKIWHQNGFPLKMAVNLSPRQFRQKDLVELVKEVLHKYELKPKYLDLEITEGIAMKDIHLSIQKLNALKAIGINISIDDFGTGYSSLSYLSNYPVDTLKIAREFIEKIGQDAGNEAIISSIIALAHNLKLNVLAEGVEEPTQLQFLKERNCNQVQGFMFGVPMLAGELEEQFLNKNMQNLERS